MKGNPGVSAIAGVVILLAAAGLSASEPVDSARVDRGREALTGRSFLPPAWSWDAYRNVGALWSGGSPDPDREAEAYSQAFTERYGLHPAPYPNNGLPMGLRQATNAKTNEVGIQVDCMLCHGGSIGGTSYVGLGNTQLDAIGLFEEMSRADGKPSRFLAFSVNTSRGTINAGQMSALLLSMRNKDLSMRRFPLPLGARFPETDTPPWWNLKRKSSMYYEGTTDAEATRSIMQFMLGDLTLEEFQSNEETFKDIHAYIRSLEAPKYPFAIESELASAGKTIFEQRCAKCHGTYGESPSYPERVLSLEEIGTDPARALAPTDALVAHYNATWFGEEHPVERAAPGYLAPPLDGIWASAPYLHNGSVPTLYHLLKSGERPNRFTRPPSTEFEHYDTQKVGWKFEVVPDGPDPDPSLSPVENRRIYDVRRYGLGNQGHTFGDSLTDEERAALIEYLKTL